EFLVRAFGGIGLNTGVNIGCDLPAGTGAWACTSSKLVKEEFEEVDGEDLLARLKAMPIQRWRYLGTSARHLGPFAEDFQAAFGLGDSPTKIAQIDADGVALRAVQALERRTTALQEETAALRAANAALQAGNSAIRSELAALREQMSALAGQRSPITTTTEGGR
ncbi:MAG: tail fiber domain-containing protein, partial [Gemmatimonadales bacterium]